MKRTLSLCMALLMIVSVLFAVPFTASAVGANTFNDTMVGDMQGLNDALIKAESGTRICLYSDITATPWYPYPIGVQSGAASKGGNVVLDLNGFSIDITTSTMKNLFSISQMTDFYVINSDPDHDSSINFNPTTSDTTGNGSVFLLDNVQASLIVSGVDISLCKDSQPNDNISKTSVINCKDFYRLYLYDSELTNFAPLGSGIIFQPAESYSYGQSVVNVYSCKITSIYPCIDYEKDNEVAYMQFAYSLLDCDQTSYKAFDLPSSCTYTFSSITDSNCKAYKVSANNLLVSIDSTQKVVDFDKADINFGYGRYGSHTHTAESLVNTMDGHYMICKACGVFQSNEEHNGKINAVAATCTTAGNTEGYNCTCGYAKATTTIPATGHQNTESKAAVAATCTTKGYTAGVYCNDCKTWISGHEEIPATGKHTPKTTVTKATLTADGKTVTACTVCKQTLSTVVIPKVSSVALSATKYTYTGKVITPTVTVKDSKGKVLTKGTDYTVTYASGRKSTGKYAVTVKFTGNYSGTKTLYFYILPSKTSKITATQTTTSIKATWKAVTGATGYRVVLYSSKGKVLKTIYTTKTSYTFSKLTKGTTYKVTVRAYKTINGTRVYSTGYTTLTTATKPGTPTLKVTAGTKKATLKWNKQTGATGYVVYMATSKNGTYKKVATVKGNTKVSYTKTGLTAGKTYYFKVRAYETVGGKNIYGAYSSVKYVKVK